MGVIAPNLFVDFIVARFAATDRGIGEELAVRLVTVTLSHPYGTQELAYFLWEEVPEGFSAGEADFQRALRGVLRSENAHFQLIWENASRSQRLVLLALAAEPGFILGQDYRTRHQLAANPSTNQKALMALVEDELIARDDTKGYEITEPFLAEWLLANET